MIRSKLSKFAWVYFVIFLSIASVSAQNFRGNGRNNQGTSNRCLQYVQNLTQEQKDKIAQLVDDHRSEMADLRTEMQSATTIEAKIELRKAMQDMIDAHRAEVRSLLNSEQQLQYDQLHRAQNRKGIHQLTGSGNNCRSGNRSFRNGRGR